MTNMLLETWEELSTEGERQDAHVRIRLPMITKCPTWAAKEVGSGNLALMLEVDTSEITADLEFPSGLGFELSRNPIIPGRRGKTRILLNERGDADRSVFIAVVENLVEELKDSRDQKDAIIRVVQRLHRWQAFMRNRGFEGLSITEQLGLYGELIFLRDVLLENVPSEEAILSWKGPDREAHDFQLTTGSVEVKSTRSTAPRNFHVSNITQLDSVQLKPLYLAFVEAEMSSAGDESLTDVVLTVRDQLDLLSSARFDEGLVEAGYIDNHADKYRENKFSLRNIRFFEVDDKFPKVKKSDIPDGVESVKYEVALSACGEFSKTLQEIKCELLERVEN